METRVLLAAPTARHIPAMAMGVEGGRPFCEEQPGDPNTLSRLLGGNVARAVAARFGGRARLIQRRDRVGGRTALYSNWLVFAEPADAAAFLAANPRFGFEALVRQARESAAAEAAALEEALRSGRFDLSKVPAAQRSTRAVEYQTRAEAVRAAMDAVQACALLAEVLGLSAAGETVEGPAP